MSDPHVATPEDVDLLTVLSRLRALLGDIAQRIVVEPIPDKDWHRLAEILARTARLVRQQIVVNTDLELGDSGGR
ncbi:hypothetical protein EV193_101164 [Herbihabitans rhizosphaerae]|uniref:Uncharacterized protein n=1 Tax=Herbihabitans rhizosphaerae TaxID=1872711 RepID=A0A4Q7L3U9_9PSEU|nr:hypothetical protein [Herbihabitans rhizosphaerae]RZS44289.1 hypothetical protein EV193_101164 [Herbihabitans rhizosphaerae]